MPDLIKMAQSGALKSHYDIRDYKGKTDLKNEDFPKEFKLDFSQIPIKNQYSNPTCVANVIAQAAEYYHWKETGEFMPMSVPFIYYNRESTEETYDGMYPNSALLQFVKFGDVPNEYYPNLKDTADGVQDVFNRRDELAPIAYPHRALEVYRIADNLALKAALYSGDAVLITMDWFVFSDVEHKYVLDENDHLVRVTDSILRHEGAPIGLHALLVYGWNEKGFLIRNSYGENWGDNGTCIMPYSYDKWEVWGIRDFNNSGEQAIRVVHPNIPKVVAKIANKFLNLFYSKK